MKQAKGYTLVELMIAAAILGVILSGVFYSLGVQNERYIVVDQVTEAQQSLRGVAEMIEHDTRRAGYLVPATAAACAHDYIDRPDLLFVSDTDAVRSIDELSANAPELLSGRLGIEVVSMTGSSVKVGSGGGSPQLKIDEGAGSGLTVNGGIIVTDRNDLEGRVACGVISSISGDMLTVDFGTSAYATSIGSNDVVAIPALVYRIQPATATDPSQLLRNGLVLAYDVEDLQVAFYFDDDSDGIRDDATEIFGKLGPAGTYPPATGSGFNMGSLREVEVSLVTVTRDETPNQSRSSTALSQGQKTANRSANLAAPDHRLRRIHTATVRLRNLG